MAGGPWYVSTLLKAGDRDRAGNPAPYLHATIGVTGKESRVALHERSALLTYEDYVLFPEDGRRHEIIDGEHFVSPAPFLRHQALAGQFLLALGPFIQKGRLGHLYTAPVDVLLSRHDVVQPDLVFISSERSDILTEANVQGAPDLVIEILSPSTRKRDEGTKLDRYERFGVQEYWLADPSRGTLTVHRLEEGRFRRTAELNAAAGDILTTPLLPGLRVPLAEIFA
jgi:Uma2 family endonuclease